MSKYLTTSLITIGFIAGMGAGYVLSPQYSMSDSSDDGMAMVDLGRADRYVDLRYINAMAVHHRGAMQLAEQVKDSSKRIEIRNLANDILKNEPVLIEELYSWKNDWYKDATKVADKKVANIGSYDEKLDLRFLNALIAHHEMGIEMTQDIRTKSTRNEILNNADAVEKFLQDSKTILEEWRNEWYGIK